MEEKIVQEKQKFTTNNTNCLVNIGLTSLEIKELVKIKKNTKQVE
jgi:hypothetical protein